MQFLLEAYSADAASAEHGVRRIRQSAVRVPQVKVIRAIYLPEEETSLLLCDAPSVDDMRRVVADAGLAVERIAPAVLSPREED